MWLLFLLAAVDVSGQPMMAAARSLSGAGLAPGARRIARLRRKATATRRLPAPAIVSGGHAHSARTHPGRPVPTPSDEDDIGMTTTLTSTTVSVRGKTHTRPSVTVGNRTIVVSGRFLRIASIHDADFLEDGSDLEPQAILRELAASGLKADLFTFSGSLCEPHATHPYRYDSDNAAVACSTSYDDWWNSLSQVGTEERPPSGKTRRLRQSRDAR